MLNRSKFFDEMERLERNYNTLPNETLEDYYMKFKFFDFDVIAQAVDYLLEYHQGNFTPKIAEILGAINEVRRQAPYSHVDDKVPAPICDKCEGTGFETWTSPIDMRFKAKPCEHCELGRRIAAGWRRYFQRIYHKELITDKEGR